MATIRRSITDFQLANPIYSGARVSFYTIDANGVKTATLATLHSAPTGSSTTSNPQTLDAEGKFSAPVYTTVPLIAVVVGPNVSSHTTGVIQLRGTWRDDWVTGTAYFSTDFVQDPGTSKVYVVADDYTSGATVAADIAAGHLQLVLEQFGVDLSSINTLTEDTSPNVDADWLVTYKASVAATRKVHPFRFGKNRLTAALDFFVRTNGSNSNTGLANTAGGAFLTIAFALAYVSSRIDLNGQNVQIRVQGGTYTENLTLPTWVGYTGGYAQFTVIGENGTVTLTGANAQPAVAAVTNGTPILFKNMTIGNANALGIAVEGDNNGIVALQDITFGTIGAGGVAIVTLFRGGSVVLMPGTFTFTGNTGAAIYISENGTVICQAGVTLALGAGRVFSNFLVNVAAGGTFYNSGMAITGSLGSSSVPWRLEASTFGRIFDLSVLNSIAGAGAAVLVPLAIGSGGINSATAYGGFDNLSIHGADVASAGTLNLDTATGNLVDVTGTTNITAVTLAEGRERTVRFTGILKISHGSSLVLPGTSDITTAAGDIARFRGYAAGVVRCVDFTSAASGFNHESLLTADRTGTDVSTAQPVFGTTEDAVTLQAATTYEFEALYYITRAAGTTSHTTAVLFGGTATFTSVDYLAQITNPTGNALGNVQQIMAVDQNAVTLTAANTVATENLMIKLKGKIRINAAGTVIPQFQYSAAPGGAPTIKRNSYFRCRPIGSNTVAAIGAWS